MKRFVRRYVWLILWSVVFIYALVHNPRAALEAFFIGALLSVIVMVSVRHLPPTGKDTS